MGWRGPVARAFQLGKLNYSLEGGTMCLFEWQHLLLVRCSWAASVAGAGATKQPGSPWPCQLPKSKRNPIASLPITAEQQSMPRAPAPRQGETNTCWQRLDSTRDLALL